MNILLTGGTGFIGRTLAERLLGEGCRLTILSRQLKPKHNIPSLQAVEFIRNFANFENLDDFDAIINLAGEPIFDKTWTPEQKRILTESRLLITEQLVKLMKAGENPPHTFISGSATGFYGNLPHSENFYDESTVCASHFSARLCKQWEETALEAQNEHTRVCLIRTGMVLSPQGGALQKMLPLYRWNLAGKLGSGKQYWAWIALEDHIQAVIFLLKNANCTGAFNLVSPNPVTNAEFTRRLAEHLGRFALFQVPAFVLKAVLGERSQLLLDNQRLIPQKLSAAGFVFRHPWLNFARILKQ